MRNLCAIFLLFAFFLQSEKIRGQVEPVAIPDSSLVQLKFISPDSLTLQQHFSKRTQPLSILNSITL
jgi:hypothetical protein